jgi:hypothetical protein
MVFVGGVPKSVKRRQGKVIGMVSVEEIEESKEWPLRPRAPGQPIEELAVDHVRSFQVAFDEPPQKAVSGPQKIEVEPVLKATLNGSQPFHRVIDQDVSRGKM